MKVIVKDYHLIQGLVKIIHLEMVLVLAKDKDCANLLQKTPRNDVSDSQEQLEVVMTIC
jgi:hypothetical protein